VRLLRGMKGVGHGGFESGLIFDISFCSDLSYSGDKEDGVIVSLSEDKAKPHLSVST